MKFKILITIFFVIFGYFFINKIISADPNSENQLVVFLRENIDPKTRYKIKQNLFPIARYKTLIERERESNDFLKRELNSNRKEIEELRSQISVDTIKKYRSGEIKTIPFKKEETLNFDLKKFKYNLELFDTNLLFNGKHDGALLGTSAYIDQYNKKTILVTGDGIISSIDNSKFNKDKFSANIIRSNITELITDKRVYKKSDVGIKDLLIIGNKIYLSYSNNVNECYNTSIIEADINFEYLIFNKLFEPVNCANKDSGIYFFNPHSSGGKMVKYDNEHILFTHGDYYYWPAPQDEKNHLGKILLINLENKKATIVSKGHRNPQGLYYDKSKNILVSAEHGPVGGDEININNLSDNEVKNFGWPISSYGEHHCKEKFEMEGKKGYDCPDYKLAPLNKSHSDYGFLEPFKYWVPSIGVTEIQKTPDNFLNTTNLEFFIGALGNNINEGDMSLHHLTFDKNYKEIINENILRLHQRIRDMKYSEDLGKLIIFLETKATIGLLTVEPKNS